MSRITAAAHGPDQSATYAHLFRAAAVLEMAAPWTVELAAPLRIDVPALGVLGACVCLLGTGGQTEGLLIFPSREAFETFVATADALAEGRPPSLQLPETLALELEDPAKVASSLREEAKRRGWLSPQATRHPVVARRGAFGQALPLAKDDLGLVTACASGLALLFAEHRAAIASAEVAVSEAYLDEAEREVRVTYPYEAFDAFNAVRLPS